MQQREQQYRQLIDQANQRLAAMNQAIQLRVAGRTGAQPARRVGSARPRPPAAAPQIHTVSRFGPRYRRAGRQHSPR